MTKKILPAPADELLGFVPFYPKSTTRGLEGIALVFRGRYIRLSQPAVEALGQPEYVVAFIDRVRRRLMITPGTEQDLNALKLSHMPRSQSLTMIYSETLQNSLTEMAGKDLTCHICRGHAAETMLPAVIFHLDDAEKKRTE